MDVDTKVDKEVEEFNLLVTGWARKLNGKRTDQKTFTLDGLRIETQIEDKKGSKGVWITLKIFQDKQLLVTQYGNTVYVKKVGEKIKVGYTRVSGEEQAYLHLVCGWKKSPDPMDSGFYERDTYA